MDRASATLIAISTCDPVPELGDLTVKERPKRHGEGDVHQGCKRPQDREPFCKIFYGVRSTKLNSRRSDDPHLIHQLIKRQIRIICGDFGIVERNELEAILSIKPTQDVDLRPTKVALTVVENDIFFDSFDHRVFLFVVVGRAARLFIPHKSSWQT